MQKLKQCYSKFVVLVIISVMFIFSKESLALPKLGEPVELPASFEGVITIYPDSENTKEVRRYWLVPSTARIVRKPNQDLAFGLVHSGVSSFDPDGINALLNVTVQPWVDNATLNNAKKLVEQKAISEGAREVSFNFISPNETTAQIMVGGNYIDFSGMQGKTVVKGGSVEAGIPFQVKVKDSFDVRCLAQAGGEAGAIFGVLYTMKFYGVGPRVHFTLTAKFEETYKHFLARVKAKGWFGLVEKDIKLEWQDLKKQPFIELKVWSGTAEDVEKFHAMQIFKILFDAINQRTGLFAQTLKPSGLPDAPGGGGQFGWAFSGGGGYEEYTDKTDFVINVDVQYTREQEIVFGMDFPTGGTELEKYVRNVTDTKKPYPTSDDFKRQREEHKVCRTNNIASLRRMRDDRTINEILYKELISNAITKGCFVDYTIFDASLSLYREDLLGSKVPLRMLLEFTK